jgi:hypothetical protein
MDVMYELGILGLLMAFGGLIWAKIDEHRERQKKLHKH